MSTCWCCPTAPFSCHAVRGRLRWLPVFSTKDPLWRGRFSSFLSGAWFKFGVRKPSSSKTDGRSSSEMKGGNATSLFGKEGLKRRKQTGIQIILVERLSYAELPVRTWQTSHTKAEDSSHLHLFHEDRHLGITNWKICIVSNMFSRSKSHVISVCLNFFSIYDPIQPKNISSHPTPRLSSNPAPTSSRHWHLMRLTFGDTWRQTTESKLRQICWLNRSRKNIVKRFGKNNIYIIHVSQSSGDLRASCLRSLGAHSWRCWKKGDWRCSWRITCSLLGCKLYIVQWIGPEGYKQQYITHIKTW